MMKSLSIPYKLIWLAALFMLGFLLCQCMSLSEHPEQMSWDIYPLEDIQHLAVHLSDIPKGIGRQITDREFWEQMGKDQDFKDILSRAETALHQGFPDLTEVLYYDYINTGTRVKWERAARIRKQQLVLFTIAECVENKGRFLPQLTTLIHSICSEQTWVMPAHDRDLGNYQQKRRDIDLRAASLAWDLATVRYVLKPVLQVKTSRLLEREIHKRVLDPYQAMITGKIKKNWWITTTNNWNAVCLAGVTGAALTLIKSKEDRAAIILTAEKYIQYFLSGFSDHGYCSEGLGYWNYGFGHYLMLGETIYQTTGGTLNFFNKESVRKPALFGARIQIRSGIYPAFADCQVNIKPSPLVMAHVKHRIAEDLYQTNTIPGISGSLRFYQIMLYGSLFFSLEKNFKDVLPDQIPGTENRSDDISAEKHLNFLPIRTWFPDTGILISRPQPGSTITWGAAMKGGNNDEHHNHNDVGSFVLAVGNDPLIYDPGAEIYTRRTFGKQRYQSKLLNSYGHSVPVIGGKLQKKGKNARAIVVSKDFTGKKDTLVLDITSAYPKTSLRSLTRTFVYSREGEGSFTLTDNVKYTRKKSFSTALITPGIWKQVDAATLLIFTPGNAIEVNIDTGGIGFHITSEMIKEPSHAKRQPTRISIKLNNPVKEATVSIHMTPAAIADQQKENNLIRNNGFENSSLGWSLGADSMATISTEKNYSGANALKIEDQSDQSGTNIFSTAIDCQAHTTYQLSGKYYPVKGNGPGVYIYFYNKVGEILNKRSKQ